MEFAEFNQRILPHLPALRRHVARQLRDAGDVDDILQDATLLAFRHYGALRDKDRILPWMKAIALNRIRQTRKEPYRAKRRTWSDMYAEAEAAPVERQAPILDELDESLALLGAVEGSEKMLLTAALYFCLQWPVSHIASITGAQTSALYHRIREIRNRMRQNPPRAGARPPLRLKLLLAMMLGYRSKSCPEGPFARDAATLRDTYAYLKLLALRHPEDATVMLFAARYALAVAALGQYENDLEPSLPFFEQRPERWDETLLREAADWHARFIQLAPEHKDRAILEYEMDSALPRDFSRVDWEAVLRRLREYASRFPKTKIAILETTCLYYLRGPLPAATFLSGFRNHDTLSSSPMYCSRLASLYFAAGNWKHAQRYWRIRLRWPMNDADFARLRHRLEECQSRLNTTR